MITEERKANGLFLKCDLTFNTTIANLEQYKAGPVLSDALMVKATNKEIKTMHTKCMGPDDMITSLSGGNQQKVMLTRWLMIHPRVLIIDEPTKGIDIGARMSIYQIIHQLTQAGIGILMLTSDMVELIGLSDRTLVFYEGRIGRELARNEVTEERIMKAASGITEG